MLDNAGLHTSHVVRRARRGLAAMGICLYFLPPYAPELNEIEPVFRQVKYQEIPQRSHTTRAGLRAAVDTGFDKYGRGLKSKSEKKLRRAASRFNKPAVRDAESYRTHRTSIMLQSAESALGNPALCSDPRAPNH